MTQRCARCGLDNADDTTRCVRCDALLPTGTGAGSVPVWARAAAAIVVILTIGISALVWVQKTAKPLGETPAAVSAEEAREEAFAREQAREAPLPPPPGPVTATPGAPSGQPPVAGAPTTVPGSPAAEPVVPGLADTENPLVADQADTAQPEMPSATLEWNRQILPPTRPIEPPAPGSPASSDGATAGVYPESAPLSTVPPTPPAPSGVGGTPAPPVAGGTTPPAQSAPPPPAQAPAPDRLADAQRAGCANAGFLGEFLCRERVRLEFCDDRWNLHPDCMLDRNATTY